MGASLLFHTFDGLLIGQEPASVDGLVTAGSRFFFECRQAGKTAIEGSIKLDSRLAWRGFRQGAAELFVGPFHVECLLPIDFYSSGAIGNQESGNLPRMVLFIMQRATRAAGMDFGAVFQ